ncbi:hypothetical protein [Thermosulfurimonas dismutans]|uniref:Uncharacterized protein n=1 Tax=Thermosulfurimonas dismutans TaxID=999894 RepID=A0A179D2E9_9BACT|nr:hypothetical protein [Thermosulfurimonas dismutans]OAQ20226.1 hypothetical protein TDIS_1728 [Thermosulfurimonas dismutans]
MKPIRSFICTTNQLEGLIKEVKLRLKVIEFFVSLGTFQGGYLVLKGLEE